MALAPERIIEVRRVHFLQVSSIDVVAQQFTAHIYIECAIQGGAEDKHGLAADGNTMTKKDGAEYKVVPSAMWYIENQFHLPGAVAEEVRECKVLKSGKDLVLIKRIYATFFCNMNMVDFPVDTQDLSVTVECQCAADGPFPVKIVKAKEVAASIHRAGFMPSAMWALHEKVAVRLTKSTLNVGENSKVYPAFAMRVRVCRKWMYHFFNIAVPIQAFSILALALPICLPQEESANRLSVTLALVITAAAYKFATSSMCPPVAYLTLLDAYILSVSGVLLLCAVQNAVLGLRSREDDTLLLSAAADYGSTLGLLAVWLLLQLYYGCKLCSAMQRRREVVGNETADEADQMRTPMTRVLTKNLQIDAKKDVQQAV